MKRASLVEECDWEDPRSGLPLTRGIYATRGPVEGLCHPAEHLLIQTHHRGRRYMRCMDCGLLVRLGVDEIKPTDEAGSYQVGMILWMRKWMLFAIFACSVPGLTALPRTYGWWSLTFFVPLAVFGGALGRVSWQLTDLAVHDARVKNAREAQAAEIKKAESISAREQIEAMGRAALQQRRERAAELMELRSELTGGEPDGQDEAP